MPDQTDPIDPARHAHRRRQGRGRPRSVWTDARLFQLAGLIEQGLPDQDIAAAMGLTRAAVLLGRKRHRLTSRTNARPGARAVARRLGIGCAKVVTNWIQAGSLRATRSDWGHGPHRQWHITERSLLRFLEDPAYWRHWLPERIPDPALRRWAQELRAGVRFLTTGQIARQLRVTDRAVAQWIRHGLLPAAKRGYNWSVRASDLESFQRPRRGRSPAQPGASGASAGSDPHRLREIPATL